MSSESTTKTKTKRINYKTAKGCDDIVGDDYLKVHHLLNLIREKIFLFGVTPIETPVFETREVLLGKGGEETDTKLVYELKDQGGELLVLRYDHTVPLTRYIAENGIKKMKRFTYGKVYRRDQPDIKRGRYREFYQCDYDVVGDYGHLVAEQEIMKLISLVMKELDIEEYRIRINFRDNLDRIYEKAGIDASLYKTVSSSIDKLDKMDWSDVVSELISKSLNEKQINNIHELLDTSYLDESLQGEYDELMRRCGIMGMADKVVFDVTLARGLEYYTGIIYEVVVDSTRDGFGVGAVIAGGRYDNMIGDAMHSKRSIPAIGVSFGINRLMKLVDIGAVSRPPVYVATMGRGLEDVRLRVLNRLWDAGFETRYLPKTKLKSQLNWCLAEGINTMIIIGTSEVEEGKVSIKFLDCHKQVTVMETDLISNLRL